MVEEVQGAQVVDEFGRRRALAGSAVIQGERMAGRLTRTRKPPPAPTEPRTRWRRIGWRARRVEKR